ncbi:MAG: hypothetical protein COU09_01510 [Candidatus Harrisonbacteria bacterium CG10_big_fil_rev_8_21_14_0_10_44_23]|uniref:Pentapeptide repeat-containing protein n=1 Tax=Candidatus Harrisonbacteria bacterium CG10_big_fil_rev_8_21_14_0_10_44_23 TaxID=1974585 RepID=A0A2H0UQ56_9BACT|nr:MAG: hypothetical protein COU09_01510 [Candidatus Harrisonbacteria bacterium CG10_big_fil_rev_8_21_14_0_10_44_23]
MSIFDGRRHPSKEGDRGHSKAGWLALLLRSVEEFNQKLKKWREDNPKTILPLDHVDLSKLKNGELDGLDCEGIDFSGSNFSDSDLTGLLNVDKAIWAFAGLYGITCSPEQALVLFQQVFEAKLAT